MEEKDRLTRSLASLLQEAIKLRKLPLKERTARVLGIVGELDRDTTALYEHVLACISHVFRQAVLATPERPSVYGEFLELKDRLMKLIPEEEWPAPIKNGVFERFGEIILGQKPQEPTF